MDDKDFLIAEIEKKVEILEREKEDLIYELNQLKEKLESVSSDIYDIYRNI